MTVRHHLPGKRVQECRQAVAAQTDWWMLMEESEIIIINIILFFIFYFFLLQINLDSPAVPSSKRLG